MKGFLNRSWIRLGLGSLIFILLFCASLSLVRPVLSKISGQIRKIEAEISLSLEEKTGLSVSYGSLSPSILSAIDIHDVVVYDARTRREIVRIKKVSVSYRLVELFSKGAKKAVKNLTLSGVKVEFDKSLDASTISRLSDFFLPGKKSVDGHGLSVSGGGDLPLHTSFSGKNLHLPFDVFIKNLSFHYFDSANDVTVSLSQIALRETFGEGGISASSDGKFFFTNEMLSSGGRRLVFSCAFTALGTVLPEIDGSSVTVKLSGNRPADFSLTHLDFLLGYSKSVLSLKSFNSVIPVAVSARADLSSGEMELFSEFKELNPFSLVSVRNKTELMDKIGGTIISGKASLSRREGHFSYSCDISSSLDERLLGCQASCALVCEKKGAVVSVPKAVLESSLVSAEFSGSVDIKKKIPSGVLSLSHFVLKNGCVLSSEMFVEPNDGGFSCFSPSVFASFAETGEEISVSALSLTAFLKKDSADFSVSFDDCSHEAYGSNGHFSIEGSYIGGKKKFVQASLSVSDFFAENALKAARIFSGNKMRNLDSIEKKLSPFIFSGNLYVSTDFKDITYNLADCVLANTSNYDEIVLFAVNGSKETLQVSQFDMHTAGQFVQATAGFDFSSGYSDFSFSVDLTCNSIPYGFSGVRTGDFLSVSGDYELNTILMRDKKSGKYSGSVSFSSLPVPLGKSVYSFSTFSTFTGSCADDFSVVVNSLEVEESSEKIASAPRIVVSGVCDKNGFVADSIVYSDVVSALEGSGSIFLSMPLGVFESVRCEISLHNSSGNETVFVSAGCTNESHIPFSFGALKNEFVLAGEITVNEVPVARFLKNQNPADNITGQLVVSGTISKPFVTVSLDKINLMLGGKKCFAQANVIYDETGLNIYDLKASWAMLNISRVSAFLDPKTFAGDMDALVEFDAPEMKGNIPIKLSLSGISRSEYLSVPEFVTVNVTSPGVSGDFLTRPLPFDIIVMKLPNGFEIFTRKSNVFHAVVSQSGNVSVQVARNDIFSFDMNGSISGKNLDLNLTSILGDLGKISKFVKIPNVDFHSGSVTGSVRVSGANDDPDFYGSLSFSGAEFKVPKISANVIKAQRADFVAERGGVFLKKTPFTIGKGILDLSADIELLGWGFGDMNLRLDTRAKKPVPIDMKFPLVGYKGYAALALDMTFNVPDFIVYLKGDVYGERGDVNFVVSDFQSTISSIAFASFLTEDSDKGAKMGRNPDCVADITVHAGQKFSIFFNPIMRAVISPKTKIALKLDSAAGEVALKGDLELRGGEIMWLGRNFYLREGKVKCNETNSSIDPIVTVRAETKERDNSGDRVTLTLSAVNQHLSQFKPSFSASPAKSEAEIMELLGQAISGDASGATDVIASGGDFFVQTLVIRKVENALRDILNFDIFSIRTNVIQNALKISRTDKKDRQISVGNYFDNKTVYVGKYFGSSIYTDAMLSMTYDETKIGEAGSINGFVFQPEFGFEMESPFVNIRFGLAPNFAAMLNNSWLPSASMTLSWKHSF